ncbi:MAG: response regulator, partial [Bacteroidota bacterium]
MIRTYIFIDDEPLCNLISKTLLMHYNKQDKILTFESAKEALQYFEINSERLALEELYVYLDINMPEMNGFDFLKEYEKKFASSFKTKICMLTASMHKSDKEKAFEFPFVKHFHSKPFELA